MINENKRYNYHKLQQITQLKQIQKCIQGHEQEINELAIYNNNLLYESLIRKNYIQYNGDTKLLILSLLRNIYMNYKINGLKCSYPLTSIKLCDKDIDRNLIQSYHTIQSRLQVLEKEGVIKRYKTNKYFVVIFLVDITKPFERKNKIDFKQKELTTTPLLNEIKEIENKEVIQQDINEDTIIMKETACKEQEERINTLEQIIKNKDIKDLINSKKQQLHDLLKQDIIDKQNQLVNNNDCEILDIKQQLDKKLKELQNNLSNEEQQQVDKEELEQDKKEDTEETFKEKINQQLDLIDIGNNDKEVFKNMFWSFCDAREGSKGQKIKKKTELAITRKTGPLYMLQEARKNKHDPYLALENCLNRGYENIGYYKDSDLNIQSNSLSYRAFGKYNDNEEYLLNDFKEIMQDVKDGKIQSLQEAVSKSKIGQAVQVNSYIKTISKYKGEKLATEHIQKQEKEQITKENDKIMQIINFCKTFDSKKPNFQGTVLNILDKRIGEKCYNLLIMYYAKQIENKYPQDKQRKTSFVNMAFSMLNIARQNNIKYIPLIYAYYCLSSMQEDWINRTEDMELLNILIDKDNLKRFIYNMFFHKIQDEEYIDGNFIKQIKNIKFYGFYMDKEKQEITKEEKILDYFIYKQCNLCFQKKCFNCENAQLLFEFRVNTTLTIDKEKKEINITTKEDLENTNIITLIKNMEIFIKKQYQCPLTVNGMDIKNVTFKNTSLYDKDEDYSDLF